MFCSGSRPNSILARHHLLASGPRTQEDQPGATLPSSSFWKAGRVYSKSTISAYLSRTKLAPRTLSEEGERKKMIVSDSLFTAFFYRVDKIKYKTWSVWIPIHFLRGEQVKYFSASKLALTVSVSHCQFHHSSPCSFPMKWTISLKWWLLIQTMFWKLKKKI